MDDYKPNSHRFREEQQVEEPKEGKKVEKVAKGNVKIKKKNEIKKFADVFVSEDASNVKSYVLMDVIIPGVKRIVWDMFTGGLKMLLFGERGISEKDRKSRTSYDGYYDKDNYRRSSGEARIRNRFDDDEIIIKSRGEAEDVMDYLYDVLNEYDVVRVLDLYDKLDITAPYTANRYGWTDLRGSKIVPVREGYLLKLPKAIKID